MAMTEKTHQGLAVVQDRIVAAKIKADRESDDVKLVAVSKTFAADHIRPVIEAGQRVFGENRVQEAQGKWPELKSEYEGLSLHLIGPLQTNKVKDAVAEALGIGRRTLNEKIVKLGLDKDSLL